MRRAAQPAAAAAAAAAAAVARRRQRNRRKAATKALNVMLQREANAAAHVMLQVVTVVSEGVAQRIGSAAGGCSCGRV